MLRVIPALVALVAGGAARAEPVTLRFATIAPDGSAWARELRAWARDVGDETEGTVNIKIYFGGVAGDETRVLDRIRREQLDGAAGSETCIALAPSLRISRVVGLFQNREESAYAIQRLRPELDREFSSSGFVNLGEADIGQEVLLTRTPVRSLAELRNLRIWVWDIDKALRLQATAMGSASCRCRLKRLVAPTRRTSSMSSSRR